MQAARERAKRAVLGRVAGNSEAAYTQAFIGAKNKVHQPCHYLSRPSILPWQYPRRMNFGKDNVFMDREVTISNGCCDGVWMRLVLHLLF